MKNLFLILILAIVVGQPAAADDKAGKSDKAEKVTWYGFNEGLKEAARTNKKVYVDVYTDWCGWCKKMDKEVFTHAKVAPYMSDKYIAVRLNAEGAAKISYKETNGNESELARAFGVNSYPTALFLEPNGDLLTTLPGYVKADDFIAVLKYFGDNHYKSSDWQKYYDQYLKDNPPGSLK